jgi:hypothetical protein
MKNVFEISCDDLRAENQNFSLKEYFLYSIDLLLSQKQKSQVDITLDQMLPEMVDGDLTKFRQIITTLLDFSFNSTKEVKVQLLTSFALEAGSYILEFKVSFTPEFNISKHGY